MLLLTTDLTVGQGTVVCVVWQVIGGAPMKQRRGAKATTYKALQQGIF